MFVNEVSILSNFSIVETGGTFDDPSDQPAQLDVQFKEDLIKFSILNFAHPRGKIVMKVKRAFTIGNLVRLMADGLGKESEVTNFDDTDGYSVQWWNAELSNGWMDELLILGRVFPELAKTLLPLPVTDVMRLRERWGGSLLNGVDKLWSLAHGFEWVDELNQANFNLAELAQFVGVSDPMDVEEIGEKLQALGENEMVIPSGWGRRHVQGRKRVPPPKSTTLDEIYACTSKDDLIALLSMPAPSTLDSFILALHRWIDFGLGRETDPRGMENNIALIAWLGKSRFISALQHKDPELALAYQSILRGWSNDNYIPGHPMAGMVVTVKRLRKEAVLEVLSAFDSAPAKI